MITALTRTVSFAIAATATLLIVAGSAAPASAATATITVHSADLATSAGIAALHAEVKRTARRLCTANDARSLAEIMHSQACTREAIAAATPQLEQLAANARAQRTLLADAATPTNIVSR